MTKKFCDHLSILGMGKPVAVLYVGLHSMSAVLWLLNTGRDSAAARTAGDREGSVAGELPQEAGCTAAGERT